MYSWNRISSSPTSQVSPDVTTKEKKARVLIVDDDPEITESFGLALEDSGLFQVEKYTDPLIALSNLKPNQYDVVLLD